jgi:beta-glucanase (GH16 family)
MSFRSLAFQRFAVSLAAIFLVSACTDNGRATPLSGVEVINIPAADLDNQANQNIANPTLTIPATFEVSPGDALTLVWSEEFDGAQLDPEVWFFATGDGTEKGLPPGWGNNELQYYLPDNAQLVNGVLEITARREIAEGLDYTSARINTEDRFAFQYGRIEASIKMPSGQGLWPAFWMLSQDSDYLCGGEPCIWAATGEVDIMEAVNLDGTGGNEIFGTIHYGGESPANTSSGSRYTPGVDVTDDYNTYAIEWDENEIRWYFNDTIYAMQNSWFSTADNGGPGAPFNQPFHVLLNVAVGGNFPGSPNGTTPFPLTMEVDWVRVYSGEGPPTEPTVAATTPTAAAADVVSLFSGAYTDVAVGDFSTTWDTADVSDVQVAGDDVKKYVPTAGGVTLGFIGINFDNANAIDGTAYDTLRMDIWTPDVTNLLVKLVDFGGDGFEGANADTTGTSTQTLTQGSWQTISIPFSEFMTNGLAGVTELSQIVLEDLDGALGGTTLFVDNLYFYTAGAGGGGGTFVNGNFETGDFTGWTLTQIPTDRGSIALDSSGQGGRAGFVARLVAAGDATGTNDVLISQVALAAGTVAPGNSIDVSFDLYGSLTGAGGVVFVEVIFLNGAGADEGGRNFVGPAAPYVPSTTWTPHSGTVIAGTATDGSQWDVSGGVTLELKTACGAIAGGCGVDASFDNVTFTIN